MSLLLHRDSQEQIDSASAGEAFTKGSSHIVWATVVATVLVTVAVVIFILAGQKPPAATGEIVQVWAHPRHVVTSGLDANGAPMAKESFDQVLIFAHVKLHNQSAGPLVMLDALANIGPDLSISAGTAGQYDQVFLAYPEITAFHETALSPHAIIEPGQTVEGTVFWASRMGKQEWDARKSLSFTFKFQYHGSLVLAPHNAVTER